MGRRRKAAFLDELARRVVEEQLRPARSDLANAPPEGVVRVLPEHRLRDRIANLDEAIQLVVDVRRKPCVCRRPRPDAAPVICSPEPEMASATRRAAVFSSTSSGSISAT